MINVILPLMSFPGDFLKVGSIIISYQVLAICIGQISLEILQMYIDRVLNINVLIMDTLCE